MTPPIQDLCSLLGEVHVEGSKLHAPESSSTVVAIMVLLLALSAHPLKPQVEVQKVSRDLKVKLTRIVI